MDPSTSFYRGTFDPEKKLFNLSGSGTVPPDVKKLVQLAAKQAQFQCYSLVTDINGNSWASSGGTFTNTFHINNPHAFPFASTKEYSQLDTWWPYMGEEGERRSLDDIIDIAYRRVQENVPDNTLAQIKSDRSLAATPLKGGDLERLVDWVANWGKEPEVKRLACALFFSFEDIDEPVLNVVVGRIACPQGHRVIMDFPLEKGSSGGSILVLLDLAKDDYLTLFATIYGADKVDALDRKSYAALISDLWKADLSVRLAKKNFKNCKKCANILPKNDDCGRKKQMELKGLADEAEEELKKLESMFSSPNPEVKEVEEMFDRVALEFDTKAYKDKEGEWEETIDLFQKKFAVSGKTGKDFCFKADNKCVTLVHIKNNFWRIDKQSGIYEREVDNTTLKFYPLARQNNTHPKNLSKVQAKVPAQVDINISPEILLAAFARSRGEPDQVWIVERTDGRGPCLIMNKEMEEMQNIQKPKLKR